MEELAKRGIPAESVVRDDGVSVVVKTNDAASLHEAAEAGLGRWRAGESPAVGATVSEVRAEQLERGVAGKRPPVSEQTAARRRGAAKDPGQLRQRAREQAPGPRSRTQVPKKIPTIGGR